MTGHAVVNIIFHVGGAAAAVRVRAAAAPFVFVAAARSITGTLFVFTGVVPEADPACAGCDLSGSALGILKQKHKMAAVERRVAAVERR